MNNISSLLEKRLQQALPNKIQYSYQELGIEMQQYFNTRQVWPLFYKKEYNEQIIREAFEVCKRRGIAKFPYLMGVLRKMK